MVEFALVLPVLVTIVFVLVQIGLTFNSYLRVTDAARVAARAAAVARFNGQDPCDAAQAAVPAEFRASLQCSFPNSSEQPGNPVEVTITQGWNIDLPLLPLSKSGTLSSSSTERLE
ncbi:MAG TPA: TadE family protein [Gaiellaceae bacterium]|nr:TadE family protein [Gaiellaceae bacterium]